MKARMAASPHTDRKLLEPVLEDTARQDPRVVLGDFRACDSFDVRERISEIQKPVLVISAEDDLMTPPKFGKYLAENIPEASWVHQHQAGHLVSVEKPDEVNQAIRELVKKL
jgi:pimeloyl-ACP methyl ester carboxylesterase